MKTIKKDIKPTDWKNKSDMKLPSVKEAKEYLDSKGIPVRI